MKKLKRFFTKKVFTVAALLILLDVTIGAIAVEYFDIVSLSEQYSAEILLALLGGTVFWITKKWYYRRKMRTRSITILKEQ